MSLDPEIREQINSIVASAPVVLFMKGNAMQPQCGFSAQVVDLLNRVVPSFVTFDVLSDPAVRDGIKEFSDWPTIPQLYINGEFQGGCDVVTEMYESGELHRALGLEEPKVSEVTIEIGEEAAGLLREAQSRHPAESFLHIGIDASYQHAFGFGPKSGREVEVDAGGLTVLLDRDSAARANGLVIDTESSTDGRPQLTLHNPNAPAPAS